MTAQRARTAGARGSRDGVDLAEEVLVARPRPWREPLARYALPLRDPPQAHAGRFPWFGAESNPSAAASSFSESAAGSCDS